MFKYSSETFQKHGQKPVTPPTPESVPQNEEHRLLLQQAEMLCRGSSLAANELFLLNVTVRSHILSALFCLIYKSVPHS